MVTCIPHRTLKFWKIRFGISLKTWFGIFSNMFEMLCIFSKYFEKHTPSAAFGGAPPRPGKGYVFQTSLKNTQHFKYVWKYTKSCFQTCPKSDFSNFQCSMRDASYHATTKLRLNQRIFVPGWPTPLPLTAPRREERRRRFDESW